MDAILRFVLGILTPDKIAGYVRHLLSLLAGWLVAKGWLTSDQSLELVAVLVSIAVPLIWSAIQKWRTAQTVETLQTDKAIAMALPQNSTQADINQAKAALLPK